jgi:hypothetical protein
MRKRLPADVLAYFRKEGARGARLQAANMTPAERKARATKASQAAALARTKKKQTNQVKDTDVVIWHLESEGKLLQAYLVKDSGSSKQFKGRGAWGKAYAEAKRRESPGVTLWSRRADGTFHKIR